jgi:hypothetical protein
LKKKKRNFKKGEKRKKERKKEGKNEGTVHRGVCCNPCNWDGRYWMPTMVGDP